MIYITLRVSGIFYDLNTNKDLDISVKQSNTIELDTTTWGAKSPKRIYRTTLSLTITFKEQIIYSKTFSYTFQGSSPTDLGVYQLFDLTAWNKINTDKYFINLRVNEFSFYKKTTNRSSNGLETYGWEQYQFIF